MSNIMKRNKYIAFFLGALMLSVSSCDFEDTNIDPSRQADVQLKDILPAAQAQAAYNTGAIAGRIPGIIIQHFEGFDAQQLGYTRYVIGESDGNNLWVGGLYNGVMKDADILKQKAITEDKPHYLGISNILMAHALGMGTSIWGDMPYSQAFKGVENLTPTFDSQEQIYTAIQALLDEAIVKLAEPAGTGAPSKDDLIFKGDAAKWIATARALKARYHMHLVKRDPQAASKALAAINAGAIASVADEPRFKFEAAQTGANPYALFGTQRPKTMIISKTLSQKMDDTNDPRKSKYMMADGTEDLYYSSTNTNLFWAQNNSFLPLISYTELKFLQAEALVRAGASDVEALAALSEAVIANMTQLGISAEDYEEYLAANVNFVDAISAAEKIEKIINQKYIALYAQGPLEVWTDYRRTGYPALTANPNGSNGSNPSGIIPRRFLYPIDERLTNGSNLQEAVKRQGRGSGLLDDDVWAFKD
jgi:hypothetical protein